MSKNHDQSIGELRLALTALMQRVEQLEAHAANQDRAIERLQRDGDSVTATPVVEFSE